MSLKSWVTLLLFVGATAGGYLPYLWGNQSLISIPSILLSGVGGVIGAVVGYKFYQYFS